MTHRQRNRVAEYHGISDIETLHRGHATEKYDAEKPVMKQCGSIAENEICPNHFIEIWVIDIYRNEANLIRF